MPDFPFSGVCPPVISCLSRYSAAGCLGILANSNANGSSTAWPSANRAMFVPIWLPGPFKLASFFCVNGSTATGNIDMGIYGTDGTLIASKGSTAQSGTSTLQILTITAVMLPPGRYYMAISASSTSTTFISRTPATNIQWRIGMLQAATQVPLATAPTFATPASAVLPIFGIAQITTY